MTLCSIDGCDREVYSRGWCGMHYQRWRTKGDPLTVKPKGRFLWMRPSALDRLLALIDKNGPPPLGAAHLGACWLWTGRIRNDGYAQFWLDGRHQQAHRATYELLVGTIPDGLVLDHLCRVRNCVNPTHLEPVTQQENSLRSDSFVAVNARKTHCLRGHEFTPENTYLYPGERACRACAIQRAARNRDVELLEIHQ